MTTIGGLYARYHGQILRLAIRTSAADTWKSELREILHQFDRDSRDLPPSCNRLLRHELATQIEQEALRFSDANKRAVLVIALKHFDSI
jgi:hypothetical protein